MFKFNFDVNEDKSGSLSSIYLRDMKRTSRDATLDLDAADENEENSSNKIMKTSSCYDSKIILPSKSMISNLREIQTISLNVGEIELSYATAGRLAYYDCLQTEFTNKDDFVRAERDHSDLIPGIYEGGAKIWECTHDMLNYLAQHFDLAVWKDKRVLDLGCGSGLLGLYAFCAGAQVHFQDYNEDVLKAFTIPNVLLNYGDQVEISDDFINQLGKKVKFFSGDWSKYTALTEGAEKFDIILSSETIYNPKNQQKLLNTLNDKLKPDGVVYIAAKIHYFGVGGGLRQFEELIANDSRFNSEIVWSSEDGLSREILKMKRKLPTN